MHICDNDRSLGILTHYWCVQRRSSNLIQTHSQHTLPPVQSHRISFRVGVGCDTHLRHSDACECRGNVQVLMLDHLTGRHVNECSWQRDKKWYIRMSYFAEEGSSGITLVSSIMSQGTGKREVLFSVHYLMLYFIWH